MKFIGRSEELKSLNSLWLKKTSSLVTIQGRRRIGKSSLVQEFANQKIKGRFLEFQGLAPRKSMRSQDQLDHFADQVRLQIKGLPKFKFENWSEAFAYLDKQLDASPTVLLFDEISWMASNDIDFVGKLKTAWDTQFKRHDHLVLVLCGSVSSWIEDNILNDTDFIGRISLSLQISELPLNLISHFWSDRKNDISSYDLLQMTAITGGVPRYLEEVRPSWSALKNIESLSFNPSGVLYSDFEKIFNDVFFRRAATYKKIVRTLVHGKKNLQQITTALKMEKTGTLGQYLKDLCLAGFLEKSRQYSFSKTASKAYYYRIKDNYLRFYLKYIEPYRDEIASKKFDFEKNRRLAQWEAIMGLQFECTILNNLPLIYRALDLDPSDIIWAGPYIQSKNSKNLGACQIDLLIHTRDQSLYLCEMKFRKRIDLEVVSEMKRKIKVLKHPRYMTLRKVLIAEGEIQEPLKDSLFFDHIIEGSRLVHGMTLG